MINVGIVDDHAVVRTGLRQFLSEHVDLRVVGEADNGRGALELARAGGIDVLLLDISMPDQNGVEALQAIKARFPALPRPFPAIRAERLQGMPALRPAPALSPPAT